MAKLIQAAARPAMADDLSVLLALYRALEAEMTAIHPMWPLADGLPEPIEDAFTRILSDDSAFLYIGTINDVPLGFLMTRIEDLLPQANGLQIGAIRLVFVDMEAREVGVGEAMRDLAMADLRARKIWKFDAHVLPGHRLVKNFFEAGAFAARSIVMHHSDDRPPD